MFIDWGFDNGFTGYDIANRTATIYDEGKRRQSGTTLPYIAKAIVATLHHPELTLNKRIFVANATYSQQEALAAFKKETGTKWTVKHVSTKDIYQKAAKELEEGKIAEAFADYITYLIYGDNDALLFDGRTSNKELGIPVIPLEQLVKEAVQRKISNQ